MTTRRTTYNRVPIGHLFYLAGHLWRKGRTLAVCVDEQMEATVHGEVRVWMIQGA